LRSSSLPFWRSFFAGARDSFPMLVGAAPFGVIFGTLAIGSGLPAWLTLGMSLLVFGGSSQFVAVSLIGSGTALPVIWLTTLVVNLRHALYSASLLPHARSLPARWRWALAFWLTDETFAVVENRVRQDASHNAWDTAYYWLGSSLAMYSNWFVWTLVGVVLGQSVPALATLGLDFAMVATFAAIVVLQLRDRPMVLAAVVAGTVALLSRDLPYKLGLMSAAVAGVAAGMLAERYLSPSATQEALP
jgi:4-azaleucine resistance transporter AzlC